MKYLLVYSHPNPESFNHAVKEVVEATLRAAGRVYELRDLYAMKFDPILSANDFILSKQGKVAQDVAREQLYVREADTYIFIYPIWWFGMPAILKGYIERIFSRGFAYDFDDKGAVVGLLRGKRVMLFNTTGASGRHYDEAGFTDALARTTDTGTFELCGLKVALHKYFYAVPFVTQAERVRMLEDLQKMVL